MSGKIETQQDVNKLYTKQSTTDSENIFSKLNENIKPTTKVSSQKNLTKEEELKKIIITDLIKEKEHYNFNPYISKKLIIYLNNFFNNRTLHEFLRQNEFLIELTNKTIQYDEDISKDIYIKMQNIKEEYIYISKETLMNQMRTNKQKIGREKVKDILGNYQVINLYNYLAKEYINQLSDNNIIEESNQYPFMFKNNLNSINVYKEFEEDNESENSSEKNKINTNIVKRNSGIINKKKEQQSNKLICESLSLATSEQSIANTRKSMMEPQLTGMKKNVIISDIVELKDNAGNPFKVKKCFIKHLINCILKNNPLPKEEKFCDINGDIKTLEPNDPFVYLKLIQNSHIGEVLFASDNKFFTAMDVDSKKKFLNTQLLKTNEEGNMPNSEHNSNYNENNNNKSIDAKGDFVKLNSISSDDDCKSEKRSFSYTHSKCYFKKKVIESYRKTSNIDTFIKMYDVNNNTIMISEYNIKKIYQKLVNRESNYSKKQIFDENGESVIININTIRSKPIYYYKDSSDNPYKDFPYCLTNEENLSYFEVTNCVDGEKILIKTTKILSLIRQNVGCSYITLDTKGTIKICIDELKEMIRLENLSNEFLKVKNVAYNECFIKKQIIFSYLKKLISNSQINPILAVKDNEGKQQYCDMKHLFRNLVRVAPSPYENDTFLKLQNITFIKGNQGFMNVKNNVQNEYFEYVQLEDEKKEKFYVRKPFIRDILYNCNKNCQPLPNKLEMHDLNNKKRRVYLKDYMKQVVKENSKYSNIKIKLLIKELYVEIKLKNSTHLVLKNDIINFISLDNQPKIVTTRENHRKIKLRDIDGNRIEINLLLAKSVNLKHAWVLVKDKDDEYCLLFKNVIKKIIINKLFSKSIESNDITLKYPDYYDFFLEKRKIDVDKILNSFLFQKGKNIKNEIIIEVLDKKKE